MSSYTHSLHFRLALVGHLLLGHVQVLHHGLQSVPLLLQLQLQLGHHLHLHARLSGRPVVEDVLCVEVTAIITTIKIRIISHFTSK